MPLVRIAVPSSEDVAFRRKVSDAVQRAMVDTIDVPPADRFHVIGSHAPDELVFDADYLGLHRTDGFIAIHITLRRGRSPAKKRALYRAIADNLREATGTRV